VVWFVLGNGKFSKAYKIVPSRCPLLLFHFAGKKQIAKLAFFRKMKQIQICKTFDQIGFAIFKFLFHSAEKEQIAKFALFRKMKQIFKFAKLSIKLVLKFLNFRFILQKRSKLPNLLFFRKMKQIFKFTKLSIKLVLKFLNFCFILQKRSKLPNLLFFRKMKQIFKITVPYFAQLAIFHFASSYFFDRPKGNQKLVHISEQKVSYHEIENDFSFSFWKWKVIFQSFHVKPSVH
jgi:hypothetical protein